MENNTYLMQIKSKHRKILKPTYSPATMVGAAGGIWSLQLSFSDGFNVLRPMNCAPPAVRQGAGCPSAV